MSSTNAPPPPPPPAPSAPSAAASTVARKGLHSRVYDSIIRTADKYVPDKMRPFWQHPAGPKTIFFYAPFFKWTLVIAGLSDLRRPAEELSIGQCASLAATGVIWSRYSLVIIPKNYSLFSVNLFVALTQLIQLGRAYNASQDKKKANALAETEAQPISK